ncbi:KPN_02809 family neutral zinc metallopeptidase [Bacteroides pyogenes]|uniref:KPN_02809 family neutral zinc metallopeptidase n=1 Tax=Bacteroides pyogenes TaxID=310300 RepID=UPI001F222EDE|nr:neutral zinc metallopeptidase [Bacteroides pyogenes]MCE9107555.1 neutral zinc metallopeptidase [Bacteroides pyogenes]
MRLDGRRESSNVDDRRGRRVGKASLGIGGTIIVGLLIWLMGGNPLDIVNSGLQEGSSAVSQEGQYVPTEEEEALAQFSKQILAGTEDVWTKVFAQKGLTYRPPKMVLFTESVHSGCGSASAQSGPFYCSADQSLYIDLSFFRDMKKTLEASGDFAYAYVIAHEVGHHVQYLLGTLDKAHAQMRQVNQSKANAISVRLELQADYYAGVWAHHDDDMFNSMEIGDLEEGLIAANAIGDDRLQMKSRGYVVPESFNHGTSKQRSSWLRKGYRMGTIEDGDTFNLPDPE